MTLTVSLPDTVVDFLKVDGSDPSRRVLESIAIAGYCSERLSTAQIRDMLGLETRTEVYAFLRSSGVPMLYDQQDLRQDLEALEHLTAS